MCSEMGFCFAALFSPVCINPGDTMKEPVCREHLQGSGLPISVFGQCRMSRAAVRGRAGPLPAPCFSLPDLLLLSQPASSCGGGGGKDEIKLRGKIG